MLIHFKCPNGHGLKVSSEYAGKRSKCPQCAASLVVPTPNSAASPDVSPPKDAAGRPSGAREPALATTNEASTSAAPPADSPSLDDADICDLLGPPPPVDTSPAAQKAIERQFSPHDPARLLKSAAKLGKDMRHCPECDAAIKRSFHVCPHCRTYLNDDMEALSKSTTTTCLNCGSSYALAAESCPQCGQRRVDED